MHAGKTPETPRELPLAETVTTRNINYVIGGGDGDRLISVRQRLVPSELAHKLKP